MNNILKYVAVAGTIGAAYVIGVFYKRTAFKVVIKPEEAKALNDTMNQINEVIAGLKTK
jgi:hypothetical protein